MADMSDQKTEPATLQVAGEDAKLNSSTADELDITNRDPKNLNEHVKIQFEDVIAEPDEGVYSFDKVWILSYKIFTGSKLWCYRITSLILGLPCALIWGVYFACLAFCNNWCCIPCIRAYEVELFCIRRLWEIKLNTFIRPCFEAIGRIFSSIRITINKD